MIDLNHQIQFGENSEISDIRLPDNPEEIKSQTIVWRTDPLTGRRSVMGEGLVEKAAMFFGDTDRDLLDRLVLTSRKNCIFCSGTVEKVTPEYPREFISEGRLEGENTILFPNLFPLSRIHAVITWPTHHFLHPGQFTPSLLADAFTLAGGFINRVREFYEDVKCISVNSNHLLPAGASLWHPHIQVLGSGTMPSEIARIHQCAQEYYEKTGNCYWSDLMEIEKLKGHRWIGSSGAWNWLTSFSPMGSNEILGIHSSATSPFELDGSDWAFLGGDLSKILQFYHEQDYSSFNYSITGGTSGNDPFQRCIIRVISRQNFRENYRTDDYFLQKLLGAELIVVPPETLAAHLRNRFK